MKGSFEREGSWTFPATTVAFDVLAHFKRNPLKDALVCFESITPSFSDAFSMKLDPVRGEVAFDFLKNVRHMTFQELLWKVRKENEATMADVYDFLLMQPHIEPGHLCNNGMANIFFVRDNRDDLRVVIVDILSYGWRVKVLFDLPHGEMCWVGQRIILRSPRRKITREKPAEQRFSWLDFFLEFMS